VPDQSNALIKLDSRAVSLDHSQVQGANASSRAASSRQAIVLLPQPRPHEIEKDQRRRDLRHEIVGC